MATRSSELPESPQTEYPSKPNVPRRIRAWTWVRCEWNVLLRHRLFPMLPPDSLLFQTGTVAQTLWFEVRSLIGRMRFRFGRSEQYFEKTDLPAFRASESGGWESNIESYARSAGIEAMQTTFPWAATGDVLMFLEGWSQAAKWHSYTSGSAGRARALAFQQANGHDEQRAIISSMLADAERHKVAISPPAIEFQGFGDKTGGALLLGSLKFSRAEIAIGFGIPAEWIGEMESSQAFPPERILGTPEWMATLSPDKKRIWQQINGIPPERKDAKDGED